MRHITGKYNSNLLVEDYHIAINFLKDFGGKTIFTYVEHFFTFRTNTLHVEQKLLRLSEKINNRAARYVWFLLLTSILPK